MHKSFTRRDFIRSATVAGIGLSLPGTASAMIPTPAFQKQARVGIIGLDTSHSPAFTKLLNDPDSANDIAGYRVVAAYPHGSKEIESSVKRIPEYTEEVKKLGVEIVGSIQELIRKVDVVLLETNDGRPHLEQVLPVLKARKPVFIDKPIAASLADTLAIFDAAKKYNTPVFSSSSLRYAKGAQEIAQGKVVGKVLGAEAYSPAHLEKTHPDLFWYGIHGVETLFTVMGTGCKSVVRVHTDDTDVVVGTWDDGRVGTFRGMRSGKLGYGGLAYGTEGVAPIGPYDGYRPLVVQIVEFFRTGKAPVPPEETIEIYAFMEAADESKRKGGVPVTLESVMQQATKAKRKV
jgi:predicted dehydrogenase